jgi:hypothetical protein
METKGIEPSTSWLQTRRHSNASDNLSVVTATPSLCCTTGCTGNAETANETTADPLIDLIASLTPEQRQRLASMLTGKQEGGES